MVYQSRSVIICFALFLGSSRCAVVCYFENLFKDNCCYEGRYSHILNDAWLIKRVMALTSHFLAFSPFP